MVCHDLSVEPGHDKIAVYADRQHGLFSHMARQLPTGKWTSKIGRHCDIEHDRPEDLSADYGPVVCLLRRRTSR